MKEQIIKAAKQFEVLSARDAENALDFVAELLYIVKKDAEENHPYASKSIAKLEAAEHEVRQLGFDISDELDGIDEN